MLQQLKSDYDNSRVVLWTIEIWNRTREAECSTSSSDPPFNNTTGRGVNPPVFRNFFLELHKKEKMQSDRIVEKIKAHRLAGLEFL